MEDFVHSQGVIWLPHVLRRLANRFTDACGHLFPRYGITVPARAVSVVHLLYERGACGVTEIAAATGQSHPLINSHVKRLGDLGLIETARDATDRRRTLVALTVQGHDQAQKLIDIRPAFVAAYERLMRDADADIFDALWRVEDELGKTDFVRRVDAEFVART